MATQRLSMQATDRAVQHGSPSAGVRPADAAIDHAVFVIDDHTHACEVLTDLLRASGKYVRRFASTTEYIACQKPNIATCLVLDLDVSEVGGLEFQGQVLGQNQVPIVFIGAQGDVPTAVRAIKAGAVDFLTKPLNSTHLLRAVDAAIAWDRIARPRREYMEQLRQRFATLTPREHDVLPLVVGGLLNKQAAAELGISEITLQIHRSNVMRKMGAASLAELVRTAERLEVPLTKSRRASHFEARSDSTNSFYSPRQAHA